MIEQPNNPKTPRDYARLFFTGFAMGSADIVPGVSGGTMAFILGVYETLIDAIKSFNLDVIKLALQFRIKDVLDAVPWRFLLALGSGIAVAILSLAHLLTGLLEDHPDYLFGFFFGLVVASIIAITTQIKGWPPQVIAALVIGTVVALVIVSRPQAASAESNPVVLFFSGMIAITAMILPGISGSFMLLIMGQYDNVLNAVKNIEIINILAVAAGCAIGLALFVRILSYLLKHYHQVVIALLVGFMIGSLYKIWPWKENFNTADETNVLPTINSSDFVVVMVLMILGFVIVNVLDHLQSKANPVVLLVTRSRVRSS